MRNDPGPLALLRAQLTPLLPPGAFLRRDRGDALLISNAPALDPTPRACPGVLAERRGSLIRFLPDGAWVAAWERAQAEDADFLVRSLLRFRGIHGDAANLRLFARGAKLLDMACSPGEIQSYDRALRQRAALALRGGCGGALYACALLRAACRPENPPNSKEQEP